jgi:hypothetical protein
VRRARSSSFLLIAVACRPAGVAESLDGCETSPPGPGEARVYRLSCNDAASPGGEARKGDWILENSRIRFALRKPEEALGRHGVGGGTGIDLAIQGGEDLLWEAIPIVAGGWMQPREVVGGQDEQGAWISLTGPGEDLGGTPLGGEASVTWRLAPDSNVLELEGAEALLYQGLPGDHSSVVGSDAVSLQPVGAATLFTGLTKLVLEEPNPDEGEGEADFVRVRVADENGRDIPVRVEWSEGAIALPPGGGRVPTGPGEWSLLVHRGPGSVEVEATLQVSGEVGLEVVLPSVVPPGWGLVEVGLPSHPEVAMGSEEALEWAAAGGRSLAVLTAANEVAIRREGDWSGWWVRGEAGSHTVSDTAGGIWSWPWTRSPKEAAHGAVNPRGLGAEDLLAAVAGGQSRRLVVDLDWVAAAGAPFRWDPVPDAIRIEAPEEVSAFSDVLLAGAWVGVVGPLTWVQVETETLPSVAALERSIAVGTSVATNGPLLWMERVAAQEGAEPFPQQPAVATLALSLHGRADMDIESVTIWQNGVLGATWEAGDHDLGDGWAASRSVWADGWAMAVASGPDWAVTSAVWLEE